MTFHGHAAAYRLFNQEVKRVFNQVTSNVRKSRLDTFKRHIWSNMRSLFQSVNNSRVVLHTTTYPGLWYIVLQGVSIGWMDGRDQY